MPGNFDLDTLRWIVISYFSGASILALLSFNLYSIQKKLYLKNWLIFWLLVSVGYIILFQAFYTEKLYMVGIYSIIIVTAGYFLYKGIMIFLNKSLPKKLNIFLIVVYILIILSTIFVSLIGWGVIIAYVTYSTLVFIAGIHFSKKKTKNMIAIGLMMMIFSVLIFLYPFLSIYAWFTPWGYMIFGMFGLLIGILLFQIHFLRQRDELIALQTKLQYKVRHDTLTNVYNRSFINNEFDKIKKLDIINVGLIFIDLNNFKRVNDELGHRKGDEVLIKVTDDLKKICKPKGLVCRFGGDEFLVIIYSSTIEEINQFKEDIINHGKSHLINDIKVEFAAGTSIRKSTNEDMDDLLDIAEKSMYQNKQAQKEKS